MKLFPRSLFPWSVFPVILTVVCASLMIAPPALGQSELIVVEPEIRSAEESVSREVRFIPPTDSVVTIIVAETTPRKKNHFSPELSKTILQLELLDTAIEVNTAVRVLLRAFNRNGILDPAFSERIVYESAHGVVPVFSQASWYGGSAEDTVVFRKPGRNVRLTAVAGEAVASIHVDIKPPPPGASFWIERADAFISQGEIEKAIEALKSASRVLRYTDSELERRIARLYLRLGNWEAATEHYQNAMTAVISDHTSE